MGKTTDPAETIKELYEEDTRRIPYPVFMRCFDQLLAAPPSPRPAPPSTELKECFRAVCMALDLGIADRQERDEDRREEFNEQILPVWEDFLPPVELKTCREILEGTVRERMEQMRRREQLRQGEERRREEDEMASAATRERGARLASALDAAMRGARREDEAQAAREAAPDEEPGETAGAEAAGEPAPTPRAPATKEPEKEERNERKRGVPVAKTVESLCRAFTSGKLPISYTDPDERRPIAHYRFRDKRVALQLMQKGTNCYVVLGYGRSMRSIPNIEQKASSIAEELGYTKKGALRFEKATDGAAHQIRLGKNSTYLLCQQDQKFGVQELAETILTLHQDLIHLLDGLRKGKRQ